MNRGLSVALCGILLMLGSYAFAEGMSAAGSKDQGSAELRIDDSEPKTDFGQDKPVDKPVSKSKLKKPRIGFKTTVKPEEMKSYHRSESGDVSAQ